MTTGKLDARIQLKRDSEKNWELNNPVILDGEVIIVSTAEGKTRLKIGNGVDPYKTLPFNDEAETMNAAIVSLQNKLKDIPEGDSAVRKYIDNVIDALRERISELENKHDLDFLCVGAKYTKENGVENGAIGTMSIARVYETALTGEQVVDRYTKLPSGVHNDCAAMIGEVNYSTLSEALANVQEGDTVTVMAGAHNNTKVESGVYKNVTIVGESGAIVSGISFFVDLENVVFQNIVFDGPYVGIHAWHSANNVTVKNCAFNGASYSLHFADVSNVGYTYSNLVVDNCSFNMPRSVGGQYLETAIYTHTINGITIKNCIFTKVNYDAVQLGILATGDIVIINNIFKETGSRNLNLAGIKDDYSGRLIIYGNSFSMPTIYPKTLGNFVALNLSEESDNALIGMNSCVIDPEQTYDHYFYKCEMSEDDQYNRYEDDSEISVLEASNIDANVTEASLIFDAKINDNNIVYNCIDGAQLSAINAPTITLGSFMNFSGNNLYLARGLNSHHIDSASGITLESYMKFSEFGSSDYYVLSNIVDGISASLYIDVSTNTPVFSICVGGINHVSAATKFELELDTYYHLVGTYDGKSVCVYINGQCVGTATDYQTAINGGKEGQFMVSDGSGGITWQDRVDGFTPVRGVDYWTEADQEKIVNDVLISLMSISYAKYNTIEDALAETNATADGKVGAYTDKHGVYQIVLLDDISSATAIPVTRDCNIQLNGHTISFTASGAYLDVNTASTVSIDGTVSGSKIETSNIESSVDEQVVKATGTHLTITGGTYALENVSGKNGRVIRAGSTTTQIDMIGCTVMANGKMTSTLYGCGLGIGNLTDCTVVVEADNSGATGVSAFADVTLTNCIVNVKATGEDHEVSGARTNSSASLTVINCEITADGYGDFLVDGEFQATPVSAVLGASKTSTVSIIGGQYKAAREALSLYCTARIDGGIFEGCQHGGGYMSGTDIKVKNATFRNIAYFGDCGWDADHFGACYCGDVTGANLTLYKCSFETDGTTTHYGMRIKGTNCNTYISDCEIDGNFTCDLSVDASNNIFVGENVDYRQDKVHGSIDTTTYAGQSFAW